MKRPTVKCVVWDLDNTLWDGVLLEDQSVRLRQEVVEMIKVLDGRGILNSIASKNDAGLAMDRLRQAGLDEYFLYPQIHWGAKSGSVKAVATALNIGIDTFAFVDDQPFELEEVASAVPEVLCINAAELGDFLARPEMNPRFVTEDSARRRLMYMSDAARAQAEESFEGPQEDFLATLDMRLSILPAREDDLRRAEELTIRTHQLNTTGYTYSYEELNQLRQSSEHKLYIAGLDDKYGAYGKIGVILLECQPSIWTIKLLLMSCRVMSRGVGTVMVQYLMSEAKRAGVRLQAEFVSNDRNRMMLVTYKFNGFHELEKRGEITILENDLLHIQPIPRYMTVTVAAAGNRHEHRETLPQQAALS